jgi:fumarate hydratase class II
MVETTRIAYDSMGSVTLPLGVLYGAQTQRALNNFTISTIPMPETFIRALLIIKRAAALANCELGLLAPQQAGAITSAIDELEAGSLMEHFPVPVLQTGSGTSTNMNANEVIAGLAARAGLELSANDHVNMGQSSNDVIPSALHLAGAMQISSSIIPALEGLARTIERKADQHQDVVKTGRTHLMDGLPIRLARELLGWASQIHDNNSRLRDVLVRLRRLPLGGTAVGSGVNCAPGFVKLALRQIRQLSNIEVEQVDSAYKGLSSIDTVSEASAHLKTCAITLMKIANDLRWMNSGPAAGLAEIQLPPLQPGSSIMVDKVNPVIPEAVCMAAARVIGCDATITIAAQAGNFQLNTMLPLAAAELLTSGKLIAGAANILGEKAIRDMEIRRKQLEKPLSSNPVLVTSLTPHIGYMKASAIAKKAREEKRELFDVAREETELDDELLKRLLDPRYLADGGRE